MTIGGSIGLIVLGAILAFAVTAEVTGLDLQMVGFILMIGGAVGLVFGLIVRGRRSRDPGAF
jgi:hypothetical protein